MNILYVTVASHCGIYGYEGKILAFNVNTARLIKTFIPSYPYPGAGIRGSGGISIDAINSRLYVGVGNSEFAPSPLSAYGDAILALDIILNVKAYYHPTPLVYDADIGATPIIIYPTNKCKKALLAIETKLGLLIITDTNLNFIQQIQVMHPSSEGMFIQSPAFDPIRNVLYVTNPSTNFDANYNPLYKIYRGIVAFSLTDTCTFTLKWNNPLFSVENEVWSSPIIAGI
jgi:hypothetical protein